jgi:hypothetical protein
VLVQVPAGITAVSVQQQEFAPDRFGIITVPDNLGTYLIGLGVGFVAVTERPPPGARPLGADPSSVGSEVAGRSAAIAEATTTGAAALAAVGKLTAADLKHGAAGVPRPGGPSGPGGRPFDAARGRR